MLLVLHLVLGGHRQAGFEKVPGTMNGEFGKDIVVDDLENSSSVDKLFSNLVEKL
jgi:hypothetical protein